MSLEPLTPAESVPPAPAAAEPPASGTPAASAPAPSEKPRKSRPRKFWDATKTLILIVSLFIDLFLIVAVIILANQVGALKMTLNNVLGQ